jgi:hypothetical protein
MMKRNESAFSRTEISEPEISPFLSQSQTAIGRPKERTKGSPIRE